MGLAAMLAVLLLGVMNAELDAANAALLAEPVPRGTWCHSCVERERLGLGGRDGWPEEEE